MMWSIIFVFLIGLSVGSFLNVVVFRARSEDTIGGRSKCQHCGVELRAQDMIPVVSYFVLGGRCRNCNKPISIQYPLVEFCTAILFCLFFLRYYYGFSLPIGLDVTQSIVYLLRDLLFTVFLIVLFVYDLRYYLILDRFSIPAMVIALVVNYFLGLPILSMLSGAVIIGGFFLFQFLISKGRWIGGGDVRMGLLMGIILGLREGLVALVLAYAVGALVGIFLLLGQKVEMQSKVPFGSFLALTTIIMLLAGVALIDWYISMVGIPPEIIDFLSQPPVPMKF
ncbi:prepilin peptidase [Patescibacteria group bacterium]|nr:prepilin peptidase [Patescibacteria group bacterium]MBU1705189.1 prepilin peptidase [Patescibacteria group bacterium]